MTLSHFSKGLIRPVSGGQSKDNEDDNENDNEDENENTKHYTLNSKQERSVSLNQSVAPH